jgi:hypothetical protein
MPKVEAILKGSVIKAKLCSVDRRPQERAFLSDET